MYEVHCHSAYCSGISSVNVNRLDCVMKSSVVGDGVMNVVLMSLLFVVRTVSYRSAGR